ncbi:hypothetical protein OH77DRAFT_1416826 [Trametes cingulata]|nr:hypothetical protein OH77DRAFT_1416826 [Trametes cingulata]
MASTPPSQFAALLRRSKFASFDPTIGQVYTTFDGHAARGNFGFKRPLALRRRNAHITVQAVDSREQQTVWRSAEPQNRWIRMWDETGASPLSNTHNGSWSARLGPLGEIEFSVDSDLVPRAETTKTKTEGEPERPPMSQATRNIDAMSDEEFDWYLRRLRQLRPAFRQYLQKYAQTADPAEKDATLLSRSLNASGNDFKDFLAHQAYKEYHSPRPRVIEQQPHRYAGLSYTRASSLQTRLNNKPHLGRIIDDDYDEKKTLVATAGMTSILAPSAAGHHLSNKPRVSTYRFNEVVLDAAPVTVGVHPEGLEGVKLRTDVIVDSEETREAKENPYPPGTKEYIAHVAPISPSMGVTSSTRQQGSFTTKNPATATTALLGTLQNITNTAPVASRSTST